MRKSRFVALNCILTGSLAACTGADPDEQPALRTIVIPPITLPPDFSYPEGVSFHSARFACGPADGAWIEAQVLSSEALSVVIQVYLGDTAYGRSPEAVLDPGNVTAFGFDPHLIEEASGAHGRLAVESATPPRVELASQDLILDLPDGRTCP